MTKGLAYVGVLALLSGLLLATCVGSARSMEILTDEQLADVKASHEKYDCVEPQCKSCTMWFSEANQKCTGEFSEYEPQCDTDLQYPKDNCDDGGESWCSKYCSYEPAYEKSDCPHWGNCNNFSGWECGSGMGQRKTICVAW